MIRTTAPSRLSQSDRIDRFRRWHLSGPMLILPTAWDALSGLIFETCGFAAVGTGSQGIAATCGVEDGEVIGFDRMLQAVRRIVTRLSVPVSADIESGYADTSEGLATNVAGFVTVGIAGCNFEDAVGEQAGHLRALGDQLDRLRTVLDVAGSIRPAIFVNAVTDSYLTPWPHAARLREALRRAVAYAEAGADGVYVPGMVSEADIRMIVAETGKPLNLLVRPGLPPVSELLGMGVRRLSFGSGLLRVLSRTLFGMSETLRAGDTAEYFASFAPNEWFVRLVSGQIERA